MKKMWLIISILFSAGNVNSQHQNIDDSLMTVINKHPGDSNEVNSLCYIGSQQLQSDSAINYLQKGLILAQKVGYKKGEAACLFFIINPSYSNNDLGKSIQYSIRLLDIYKEIKDYEGACTISLFLQGTYRNVGDYRKSLYYAFSGEQMATSNNVMNTVSLPGHRAAPIFSAEIANTYLQMNQVDSALFYVKKAIAQNELFNNSKWNFPFYLLAKIQYVQANYKQALENFRMAILLAKQNELQHQHDTLQIYSGMSTLFVKTKQMDSVIYYGQMVVHSTNPDQEQKHLLEALGNLGVAYKSKGEKDSAIKYIELSHALKDSMFNIHKDREVQNITFIQSLKEQEIIGDKLNYKNRVQLYSFIVGTLILLVIALILSQNYQQQKKAKIKIQNAYSELKSTQAQLIESEKQILEAHHHKELLELEAQALRAQMNPHFIFNCMNSIKALIQQKEEDKAITYLTTFSKLIRTIFQNSDRKEISLFDEIEICMLYTQLESMRFGNKFNYKFHIDETIDLKSVMVPQLIIQPFIENAIWHGIMPKDDQGILNVTLKRENEVVNCFIDDNGIGREMSRQNKFKSNITTHQSKGVHLTQTRLSLDNFLNRRNTSVNIIDKKNSEGKAEGITVILQFEL
jgi:tetratricopeptide (TPR) repeat protein